ncbi:MAG: class C beta-lactamase-related serine hydrolase [Deltaproteobacteria bacterium]|nr:MAG: class C beta-lactamase-related serine hydrolase [Deltaproteobacteria bacterium]
MRAASVGIGLVACAAHQSFDEPIEDDGVFSTQTPSEADLARFEEAAAWSERHGGLALVVLRGEHILFESFAEGYHPSTPVHLFSGTKSFSCPVVLALEAQGALSLDEPVVDTLPDLAAGEAVQIRHLLDFSSGIRDDFWNLGRDALLEEQRVEDKVAHAVARPSEHAPGERFVYGGAHQWVLSGLLRDKLDQPALVTFDELLLDPIGLRYAGWLHDPAGNTALPLGAFTTAHQWLKFGVLMRDDGLWQGERVLPEGVRDRCFAPSAATESYGLTFWRNGPLGPNADARGVRTLTPEGPIFGAAPSDTVAAAGYQDQRLYIIPSLDLVVVRLGEGHRRFTDEALLERLLPE